MISMCFPQPSWANNKNVGSSTESSLKWKAFSFANLWNFLQPSDASVMAVMHDMAAQYCVTMCSGVIHILCSPCLQSKSERTRVLHGRGAGSGLHRL